MARWPRIAAAGIPMHITQRGHNRCDTFCDDQDRTKYLELLRYASRRERCAIHAYALMSNHVHLLVTPTDRLAASRMMQLLGSLYVRYFNTRHHRSGTLWGGRFKSSTIDSRAYMLRCCRYIDCNPVRAGMVASPDEYPWTSFACLGRDAADALITPHPEYLALGDSAADRCQAYRTMCGGPVASRSTAMIRRATHGGSALGSRDFRRRLTQVLQRPVTRRSHGGRRRRAPHHAPRPDIFRDG